MRGDGVRAWRQASPYGELTVVLSADGVHEISLPGDDQPEVALTKPDRAVARQLDDWFAGRRHAFDLTLDLAGRPRAARAAGSAMRNNPIPFVIPCHRVIAAGNKIGGYGGGRNAVALKRELLAREGVSTLR